MSGWSQRSFEKVRQASGGMPAVLIRQLDALSKVMAVAPAGRAQVIIDQAAMIERVSERTVPELADRADITAAYKAVLALRRPCPVTECLPPGGGVGEGASSFRILIRTQGPAAW